MDQTFVTSFIRSAGYWAFVILLGVAGFFFRQWFLAQELTQKERDKAQGERDAAMLATMAGLTTSISKLNDTLVSLGEGHARHDERIEEHDRQLRGIWEGKNCLNEGCPLRPK